MLCWKELYVMTGLLLCLSEVVSTFASCWLLLKCLQLSLAVQSCILSSVLHCPLLLSASAITWSIHCLWSAPRYSSTHLHLKLSYWYSVLIHSCNLSKRSQSASLDFVLYFFHRELSLNVCVPDSIFSQLIPTAWSNQCFLNMAFVKIKLKFLV